jgi:hypothetical protein
MGKPTDFDLAVQRIERAFARLQRIRDGIESIEHDDVMSVRNWRPAQATDVARHKASDAARGIPFHKPVARSYRLANAAGATSFTFQHRSVSKVTHTMIKDGVRNRPGAARAHSRYIEREAAVAQLNPETSAAAELSVSDRLPSQEAEAEFHTSTKAAKPPIRRKENEHERRWDEQHGLSREIAGRLVEELRAFEPSFGGGCENYTGSASLANADLRLLSSLDLVRAGRSADRLLLGAADVSLETGSPHGRLRQPAAGLGTRYDTGEIATLQPSSIVAAHDKYIARMDAVAVQPDGTRALLTNIDHNNYERARFWSLVEELEAVASLDQVTFRVNDAKGFWAAVSASGGCPATLQKALRTCDPDKVVTLQVKSGKKLRRFLEQVLTSMGLRGPATLPAKINDGRSGRTQYRIVGELPNELTIEERFSIVRDFARVFEEKKMPFVAVMHAPDHRNDEKNWHFHLDYYDRPSRRIDAADIAHLKRRGYSTERLEPGMWDFAVVLPKPGRTNGRSTPLKQNKVSEVSGKQWIKRLRKNLADITNRHMADAGYSRRVDPRSYSEMGIVADPQEHLGSHAAIAETQGQPTKTGTANEHRQWTAILAQADDKLQQAFAQADTRVATFEQERLLATDDKAAVNEAAAKLRESLRQTAVMDDAAFRLEQQLDRARSRALKVRRANAQLLKAFDADSTAGSDHESRQAEQLVAAATGYLALHYQSLNDEYALISQCLNIARLASNEAALVEQQPDITPPLADHCSENALAKISDPEASGRLDDEHETITAAGSTTKVEHFDLMPRANEMPAPALLPGGSGHETPLSLDPVTDQISSPDQKEKLSDAAKVAARRAAIANGFGR